MSSMNQVDNDGLVKMRNMLNQQFSSVWGQPVKVSTKWHTYSKNVRIDVASELIEEGCPGKDYSVLKLVADLQRQEIIIRLMELTPEVAGEAETLKVINDFARSLGDWQVKVLYDALMAEK